MIFFNFVHLTTSHGVDGSGASSSNSPPLLLDIEEFLECRLRNAGEDGRGDASGDGDRRDENRRSNGRNARLGRGVEFAPRLK